ncbi:MAG: SMI1/KNR4 family protein [Myxococcota bacterium]
MHRGIREFIGWVEERRGSDEVALNPPSSQAELGALEQMLGGPLPTDLRIVLRRFNGGTLPNGTLLPAGIEPGSMGAAIRDYAEAVKRDFLDPELLLPFHKTTEGSYLAFDRSAGPVADTWAIVDYYPDADAHNLVYRTLDGWCRHCVATWTSEDHGREFSLDTYLRNGERHVEVEPDVATAHATVAHALKRAGRPEDSLAAYLGAARCVPPIAWCDWDALKLAALLGELGAARESAERLSSPGPEDVWERRETEPGRIAEVVAMVAWRDAEHREDWLRRLDALHAAADDEDRPVVLDARSTVARGEPPTPPRPHREDSVAPRQADNDRWWAAARAAYGSGQLREDDMLFDPELRALGRVRPLADLLRIRRDF